jgi:hypothetical protein
MSLRNRSLIAAATCAGFISPGHAADDRARVTAVADRFVAAFQESFPVSYAFTGLPPKRNDGIDINAPADIAHWHALLQGMTADLASIKPDTFADQPEWVTWHFLNQALKQDAATAVCRNELWADVTALGWQSELPQIAGIQPVGTDEAEVRTVDRPRDCQPPGGPAPRLLGHRGRRAIDARATRQDARRRTRQIRPDGSRAAGQDALLRGGLDAGHLWRGVAGHHPLPGLPSR